MQLVSGSFVVPGSDCSCFGCCSDSSDDCSEDCSFDYCDCNDSDCSDSDCLNCCRCDGFGREMMNDEVFGSICYCCWWCVVR